jgi:hypothetical protein
VPDRVAKLTVVIVAVISALSLITVWTWPPYEPSTWRLQHPPAWWQLEGLASIGVLLLAGPSYFIYMLDGYFAPGSAMRSVIAILLTILEVGLLAFLAHKLARFAVARLHGAPDSSL